uniref:Uncharacterized protein n=1 Tax=Arundo donax TaxID=35708 RepID=A0A0A9CJZ9_ARUDO
MLLSNQKKIIRNLPNPVVLLSSQSLLAESPNWRKYHRRIIWIVLELSIYTMITVRCSAACVCFQKTSPSSMCKQKGR